MSLVRIHIAPALSSGNRQKEFKKNGSFFIDHDGMQRFMNELWVDAHQGR